MNNLLNGVDEFGNTGLEHLSDVELLEYATMISELPKRDVDNLTKGFDSKALYHVVRLLSEVEQIMVEHDLDIERNREQLKAIRRGEWTLEQLESWFTEKERALETTYSNSTLKHKPDEKAIKAILLNALEMYYGSLGTTVIRNPEVSDMLRDFQAVIDKYSA